MASTSLRTRQCVVWTTVKPTVYAPRSSSHFTAMGQRWHLKMNMIMENDIAKYKLWIDCGRSMKIQPFSIETYLEDTRNNVQRGLVLHNYHHVTSSTQQIWLKCVTDIQRHIRNFDEHDDVTVVCILLGSAECSLVPTCETSAQTVLSLHTVLLDSSPNYENLSQDFRNLLDKNVMTDVQLKSGQHTVSAHKIILAARSEVFRAMFQHQTTENESGVVNIQDMDPPVLDAFLKYLYSGKVPDNVPEDMVPKLYAAGDKYAVFALKNMCSNSMARSIQEENFVPILTLAYAHSDDELKEAVCDFIVKNSTLLASDAWIAYSKENPKLGVEIYQKYVAKAILK